MPIKRISNSLMPEFFYLLIHKTLYVWAMKALVRLHEYGKTALICRCIRVCDGSLRDNDQNLTCFIKYHKFRMISLLDAVTGLISK